MPETPFLEANVLLAVIRGDEDEALRLLDEEFLPGERAQLVEHLNRLSILADDRLRCPGCNKPTDAMTSVLSVGFLGGPRAHWHRGCFDNRRDQ